MTVSACSIIVVVDWLKKKHGNCCHAVEWLSWLSVHSFSCLTWENVHICYFIRGKAFTQIDLIINPGCLKTVI